MSVLAVLLEGGGVGHGDLRAVGREEVPLRLAWSVQEGRGWVLVLQLLGFASVFADLLLLVDEKLDLLANLENFLVRVVHVAIQSLAERFEHCIAVLEILQLLFQLLQLSLKLEGPFLELFFGLLGGLEFLGHLLKLLLQL